MKFIDEAIVSVQSGKGGSGCVSFRREKHIPRGGPDGGDGGKGGDVVFISTTRRRTLYQFRYKNQINAGKGANGLGKRKTGKNGNDIVIEIPPGTVVTNAETGEILKDFTKIDEPFVIAKGGRGGRGNARFKTSTHRTPRFAQPGEPGIILTIKLDLKLLADVGIIGLPNAGKSTLVAAISSARPKIDNYPFTTLTPNLGVAQAGWGEPFIIADIPGLIEGAHKGTGLGIRFLKHIERTHVLVHLIDASTIDPDNPLETYDTVNRELLLYNHGLVEKPQLVVLNKLDLPGAQETANIFQQALKDNKTTLISAIAGSGVDDLLSQLVEMLE